MSKGQNFEPPTGVVIGTPMPSQDLKNRWVYGLCAGCIQADCSLRVYLKDGVVSHIEGNPDSPLTRGKICLRSIAGIMGLYNPYRVKSPMKRTNPKKGTDIDPGWVEISWDEAFDTIASRLQKIRRQDPRKLAIWWGLAASEGTLIGSKWADLPGAEEHLIPKAFGTPNMIYSRPLCAIHYASNLVHGQRVEALSDLQFCDYVIAPGRSLGPNFSTAHASNRFINAIERGMKLVVVDPRFSPEASKAYRWLPIRPGTDLAFALAMIYVIFYEIKKFDEWSVKNRTNGPYLIGPDGYYLRNKPNKKPIIWDPADNCAKTFDDPSIKDYSLEGEYTIDGVTGTPALQLLKNSIKSYLPEWAEKITTIPAATIREVTREFVEHSQIGKTITIEGFEFPYRPAQFAGSGRGAVNHKNGTYFDLAGKIINLLVGNMEVPGGITGDRGPGAGPHILQPDEDGVVTPIEEAIAVPFKYPPDQVAGFEFYPHAHALPHIFARAVLNPEKYHIPYELEAVIFCGGNSIRAAADREMLIEAFRKIPFLVSFALNFDETNMMADILLPEPHFLERRYARFYGLGIFTHQNIDDSVRGLIAAQGRNAAIKPLFNTKLMDDALIEIADRSGFLKGSGGLNDLINQGFQLENENKLDLNQKYSIEEILDRRIKAFFGSEYSFASLLEHGIIYKYGSTGKRGYNYYYWPDNKTRFPIYFNKLKESGDKMRENLKKNNTAIPGLENQDDYFNYFEPIPRWVPNHEGLVPAEFDMWACNWKTNFMPFGTGDTQENAWLSELRENDSYELFVWINSLTAGNKGLQDGDEVCVESRYGKTTGKLKLTELIHPEVIGIPACHGSCTLLMCPYAKEGTHFNALLAGNQDTEVDPVHGGVNVSPRVKIYLLNRDGGTS